MTISGREVAAAISSMLKVEAVSYTHLTLPTSVAWWGADEPDAVYETAEAAKAVADVLGIHVCYSIESFSTAVATAAARRVPTIKPPADGRFHTRAEVVAATTSGFSILRRGVPT